MEQWIVEQNIDKFERFLRLHFSPADRCIVENLLSTERQKFNQLQGEVNDELSSHFSGLT